MYEPPSRFELTHYILNAEAADVQIINMKEMEERSGMTLLCDGWEDEGPWSHFHFFLQYLSL